MLADWIYWFARKIYGLSDDTEANDCDAVVALGYGFSSNGLPDAAQKTTKTATLIAKLANVPMVICNVNYFGEDKMQAEDAAKREIIQQQQFGGKIIVAKPCQNSVTEARNIKQALSEAGIDSKKITVVCDWPHGWSTWIIWRRTFTGVHIRIKSIDGQWDSSHFVPAQRSNLSWLITNILRHGALVVMGIDWVAKKQYEIKGKTKKFTFPRWARLSMTGGVVLLLVLAGFRSCGSKKPVAKSDSPAAITGKKPDTKPEPPVTPTTVTPLQRIESAITVVQNGLTDLAKGLTNINSRVEILEKRLTPQVTSRTTKKAATPVTKSPPPVSPAPSATVVPATTAPFPATAVDLSPVERGLREGLGEIAEAIKETHAQLPIPVPVPAHTAEPLPTTPTLVSDNPCANWTDPARHRRCRLYNQLP